MIKEEKNIGDCDKPGDPPELITYSCVYEFMSIYNCAAQGLAQNNAVYNKMKGIVRTSSIGPYNNLATKIDHHSLSAVGTPTTYPFLLGLLTPQNWEVFVINNNKRDINDAGGGPGWVYRPWENQLEKINRWKVAKFFYEETHERFDKDPDTGEKIEFECPQFIAYNPPLPDKQFWEDNGVECPNYYKLAVCTSCNGEKSTHLKDIYAESTDEVNGPVINYPYANHNNYIYDCYDVNASQGAYVKDDLIYDATNKAWYLSDGSADPLSPWNIKKIEDLSFGPMLATYAGYPDCQECRLPHLLVLSEVEACTGEDCDSVSVVKNNLTVPWGAPLEDFVNDQKVFLRYAAKNASNSNFLQTHATNQDASFIFKSPNNNKCYQVTWVNKAIHNLGCINYDVVKKFLRITSDLESAYPAANIYDDYCQCEDAGGSIGFKTSPNPNAFEKCNPLSNLLKIVKEPEMTNSVDEFDDESVSVWALSEQLSVEWRLEKVVGGAVTRRYVLRDGDSVSFTSSDGIRHTTTVKVTTTQTVSTGLVNLFKSKVTLENVSYDHNGWRVRAKLNNLQGLTKLTDDQNGYLDVDNKEIKIVKGNTRVTLVKISSYPISAAVQRRAADGTGAWDVTKSANPCIDNEWRWIIGDYPNIAGKWYLVATSGSNLRVTCKSSTWGCQNDGGIQLASNQNCIGAEYWDARAAATRNYIAVHIDSVEMRDSWDNITRNALWAKGITANSNNNQTNRWQLTVSKGPYNEWSDIPFPA